MKHFFILLFSILNLCTYAQHQINGKILDSKTKNPLVAATISANKIVEISDNNGDFQLSSENKITRFEVSFVGYKSIVVDVDLENYFVIFLDSKSEYLQEIKIKENPAITIIRKAIANKNYNDPDKRLKSYNLKSYNKIQISAHPDSINGKIDSIFVTNKGIRKFVKLDSTQYKFKKLINKQHIYQTEKYSDIFYDGKNLKENVIATKMAGFKMPIYELLGLKLQSFSVYENIYELLENKYIGPISNAGLKEYYFKIIDSSYIQNRKIYQINFKPKSKESKNKLFGSLYIDTQNFAIAKVQYKTINIVAVTSDHEFEYHKELDLWFSSKQKFKVLKGETRKNIKILGSNIQIEENENPIHSNIGNKYQSDHIYLTSETNYFDKQFNQEIFFKKPSVIINIPKKAIAQDEDFWNKYRLDTLDNREIQTYKTLDSLISKEGIERKLYFGRKALNGYIPISFFDLDLRYLVKYNNYEGFRFGIGGVTNERLSKTFKIDGYTAYGLKDNDLKYSFGASVRIGEFTNTWIGANYTDDVLEIASTKFDIDKRVFKIYDPRPINISTFYNHKTWKSYIKTLIIPKTESLWQFSQSYVEPLFDYKFINHDQVYSNYNISTAMVSVQWDPLSDFMQTPSGRLEVEKKYPKFTFQFTKSIDLLENDFDFGKIDARVEYQKKYLNHQKSSVNLELGWAFGATPLTHLYSTSPNSLTKDLLIQRITISGKNSFETMYFNEFFSSQYASLQIKHAFQRVKLFEKIKPSLVLVTRMAFGKMSNYEKHLGLDFKTLDKGYFESGIELNQIYKVIGLSGFFRYGPNQLPKFEDNISIKLTFNFSLGI